MITAETVNGIVKFQADGLPAVSLYGRVDPGASQREVRARVDSLWAGSMSAIDTLLVRDGVTLIGVVCDDSRWLAASGDICPVCGKPTRYAPDILDELAAAVIETGGSARQIAADLMSGEYPTPAQLRFPSPPPESSASSTRRISLPSEPACASQPLTAAA